MTTSLLRPTLSCIALALHCVYPFLQMANTFSQTEEKEANGTDPDIEQPHSRSGLTL